MNFNDFFVHVEQSLSGLAILSRQEEEQLVRRAGEAGLAGEDATRCILLAGARHGVAIERLMEEDFGRRVAAALGDGFLTEGESAALVAQGTRLLGGGRAPGERAKTLLGEWLSASGAVTEAQLRGEVASRLAGTKALDGEQWQELRRVIHNDLRSRGVTREALLDGELPVVFAEALAAAGVAVRGAASAWSHSRPLR